MAAGQTAVGMLTACLVANQLVLGLGTGAESGTAIVSELRGSASVEEKDKSSRAVQLYDWLTEGATITVAKRSTVVIVLASGARFELRAGARVTILPVSLRASALVRSLPPLPAVPDVPPILASRRTARGFSAGAVRIPGGATGIQIRPFTNLYPSSDDATIAASTRLRFEGPYSVNGYVINILDDTGLRSVFEVKTMESVVNVPPGVLEAGREYYWSVTVAARVTLRRQFIVAFTTLPASTVEDRDAFIASLRPGDPRDLGLLAQVDKRLGLLLEARDELLAAIARAPTDGYLRRMLGDLDKQLESRR